METTAKRMSPKRKKLLKRYGSKVLDWTKVLKKLKSFKDKKIDAQKLRNEAWKTKISS